MPVSFNADLANGENATWNFGAQNIGGTGTAIPQFAASYSCDPIPDEPAPGASDQRPMFEVKTAYSCAVSLTPLLGNDRRTQTKNFSFTTPSGQLIVTAASAISTVLVEDTDNGGIVFTNHDAAPITITGLTLDASYQDLATINGPIVLRIADPTAGQSLFDYHLENAPTVSASTFSHVDQVSTPRRSSFTIPANGQKMLPIQILGVHMMSMQNTIPTITISVRDVATDRADMRTTLVSPIVSWSCVVELGGFNPYATSGPFATGQVCH